MVYDDVNDTEFLNNDLMFQMRPKYFSTKMKIEELFTNFVQVRNFFDNSTFSKRHKLFVANVFFQ